MLRLATALVLVVLVLSPASGQTPKRGGILHAMQAEDLPAGFSIHETATIMGLWPVMPCYSNLVLFDPLKPRETPETIIPELAVREEPRPPRPRLQLRAHAGGLAGPLGSLIVSMDQRAIETQIVHRIMANVQRPEM